LIEQASVQEMEALCHQLREKEEEVKQLSTDIEGAVIVLYSLCLTLKSRALTNLCISYTLYFHWRTKLPGILQK
jgi:hypothetical protein